MSWTPMNNDLAQECEAIVAHYKTSYRWRLWHDPEYRHPRDPDRAYPTWFMQIIPTQA